jgi:hypothetical protein
VRNKDGWDGVASFRLNCKIGWRDPSKSRGGRQLTEGKCDRARKIDPMEAIDEKD